MNYSTEGATRLSPPSIAPNAAGSTAAANGERIDDKRGSSNSDCDRVVVDTGHCAAGAAIRNFGARSRRRAQDLCGGLRPRGHRTERDSYRAAKPARFRDKHGQWGGREKGG